MRISGLALLLLIPSPGGLLAQTPPAPVADVLQRHCLGCHQGAKARGDLRLDTLPADFAGAATTWGKVFDRVSDGTMPPRGKARPTEADVQTLTRWIGDGLVQTEAARIATEGRTPLRRLNRVEYANTLRDLLGIQLDLSNQLPEDASVGGFDNVAAALQLSPAHLERYLEGADLALDAALTLPPMPKPEKKIIRPKTADALRLPSDRFPIAGISQGENLILYRNTIGKELFAFRTNAAGFYRFRIPLFGHHLDDKPYAVAVSTGITSGGARFDVVDYFDLQPGVSRVVEFEKYMPRGGALRLEGHGFAYRLDLTDPKSYPGPGWGFGPIEIEGPLMKDWPPASRSRLLGKVDPVRGTLADAEIILTRFLPRAFRRPTSTAEVAPFLKIVKDSLAQGQKFEPALHAALRGVLCAPDFLFLREKPGPLDDHALACRLSYFLWSSMPDHTLTDLARTGRLRDPQILHEQVERMLTDPKAQRFTENFAGQWLSLRDIEFTTPDRQLYPEFDERLQDAMLDETQLYFEEMLKQNRPVSEFIVSNWTMLNGTLAAHYGIPGVKGQAFRKVTLPPGSVRGGLLTQAAILKVTANGTATSPVQRGVWVLDRILGQPVPPPPASVSAVEPDIRGATTIREQLAKHRNQELCAVCHRRIDPPGFALEAFDPIGGHRDRYRSTPARGQRVTSKVKVAVQKHHTITEVPLGLPVEQGDVTPDGQRFKDIVEYRRLLLREKETIVRNLAIRLTTYATGALPGRAGRPAIDAIVAESSKHGDGFRDLIHAVVQSPLFLRK